MPLEAVDEERLDASLRQAGSSDETTRAAAASDAKASFRVLVAAAGEGCALAITLYYGEGYSTAEIAELLDTTAENVRQRLSRGRKRIARALGCAPRGVAANEETDAPRMPAANPAGARRALLASHHPGSRRGRLLRTAIPFHLRPFDATVRKRSSFAAAYLLRGRYTRLPNSWHDERNRHDQRQS